MRILGIETSCDETAASVVEDGVKVLSNVIATSSAEHARYGGVFPEMAARRQLECIVPALQGALDDARVNPRDLDAVAVTKGPGLLPSLLIGVSAARVFASRFSLPLIGVHHTLGHLSSPWLERTSEIVFPVLALSVSGGHTELWLRESHAKGALLGRTRDDAAGEAFDKGAVLLGLPYPGGPALSRLAEAGDSESVPFPLPFQGHETCDMSFSGLKTSLKYLLRDKGGIEALSEKERKDIAASYQEAICKHLVSRITQALGIHPKVREVHLVGGVSANIRLRALLQELVRQRSIVNGLPGEARPVRRSLGEGGRAKSGQPAIRWPKAIEWCTDNAAMIAAAAYFMAQERGDRACSPFEAEASAGPMAF